MDNPSARYWKVRAVLLFLSLKGVGFDPRTLLASAEAKAGAGLPHVMTRFYTVPDAMTARPSVVWLMFLAAAFFACTTIFGLAALHYFGPEALRQGNPGGNLTLPLLAEYLGGGKGTFGGELMLSFVSAVAVSTIIAVVAGLTLATSGTVANDLYVNLIMKGDVEERQQILAARITAVAVGIIATLLGILAEGVKMGVLVILAICIAASANFPVLVLSLFWKRFNTGRVIGG